MAMRDSVTLDKIVAEATRLSAEDRVRLIQRVAETLLPIPEPSRGRLLKYGEFGSGRLSTDEDFRLAEWRPRERETDCP
jgi:hypothetical protein